MRMWTKRGYPFLDVSSAMQKAIRRGDARLAGYWAVELWESNFKKYLWRRLLTISAEDCWGLITHEIQALYQSWLFSEKQKKGSGRVFASKAAILLAMCRKCRDADHLNNLVYDQMSGLTEEVLERDLAAARGKHEEIPDYAYDVHTSKGKSQGKTKRDFFREEYEALKPRQPGLFDKDVEKL